VLIGDTNQDVTLANRTSEQTSEFPGYTLTNVPSDGNCMFHSLNHKLGFPINQQAAANMRQELCAYMTEHYANTWETHGGRLGKEWLETYIKSMSKKGEYGDGIMLEMFAQKYGRPVHVHSSNSA